MNRIDIITALLVIAASATLHLFVDGFQEIALMIATGAATYIIGAFRDRPGGLDELDSNNQIEEIFLTDSEGYDV